MEMLSIKAYLYPESTQEIRQDSLRIGRHILNKFFVIGKCYSEQNSGPANIIRGMLTSFKDMKINIEPVLLSEECSTKKFLVKLFKILVLEKHCVINVHTEGYLIALITYLMSIIDVKNDYYLTIHGIYSVESKMSGQSKKRYCLMEKFLYTYYKNIICVSEMLKNDIVRMYNRKGKIYVIPNATDAMDANYEKTAFIGKPVKIVMLGGIKNRKGIWESLELIYYLLKRKKIPIIMDIYGGFDNQETLHHFELKVRQLKIEDVVKYKGNVQDKEEIYKILSNSEFQLCLSKYDTFNVAIIESLILGCPCISSNKCGAAYLIDNYQNGLVVDVQSKSFKEDVYIFLNGFVENPEKYDMIKKNGERIQNSVSWKGVCESYLDCTNYMKKGDCE